MAVEDVEVEALLPVEPALFVEDVAVWVPDEPEFVVADVEVEVCEPDKLELFEEDVCVVVEPEPP